MEASFIIQKKTINKWNADKLKSVLDGISKSHVGRAKCNGVKCNIEKVKEHEKIIDEDDGQVLGYEYEYTINLSKKVERSENAARTAIEHAQKFLTTTAKGHDFKVLNSSDKENKEIAKQARGEFHVPVLSLDIFSKYFSNIYERDAHIRIIHDSVETAIATDFNERGHILLYGKPASCKTLLFKQIKEFYEMDNTERVCILSSVAISKAGIENWILERAQSGTLPELLVLDELEKFNMDNLLCLLNIMDASGKIFRLNSRQGKVEAEAKCIIMGTCNDEQKLRNFADGALWSRFSHKLYCARPTKPLMLKIMLEKLKDWEKRGIKVNNKWAEKCQDFAEKELKTDDPRAIISLLAGRERIDDGSYFNDYRAILKREESEPA